MAKGQQVTRSVGFAILRVNKHFTVNEVVFAEKGDLLLLGARTLEGLKPDRGSSEEGTCCCWPSACRVTVRKKRGGIHGKC